MVSPDILVQFGRDVRRARTAKLWTLTQLAHQAFGNQERKGYVSQIENGRKPITALTIAKLAKALDLPASVTNPILGLDLPQQEVETEDERVAEAILAETPASASTGVSEPLLIALAFEYAHGSHGDVLSAYAGLRAALDSAANILRRGAMPSNLDAQVKATLAEVARLTADNQRPEAKALIDRELSRLGDEVAERNQARSALMASGVDLARTLNDPQVAADYELARLSLEAPPDLFEALRTLRREWYERGRDKGLAFDLQVSIALAETSVARAGSVDQRGTALNDLANALSTLGEREPGTTRLEAAFVAYTEALKEWNRDRVPLDWAMTQNNLGTAQQTLGEREPGTARLEAAVAAYTEALKEWSRDRAPMDWAMTQNNLGTALSILGAREPGTARLEAAVAAYTEALTERTRDRVPLDWAATQNNLGNALQTLGEREPGTARLEAAVAAYTEALKERTRDRVPLQWATTQNNLGNALASLGAREPGTARLEAAVAAYAEALKERTRDRVPLHWAATQNNLATALATLGEREPGTAQLEAAVAAYAEALKEYASDRVPLEWAMSWGNQGQAKRVLADRTNDLDLATTALRQLTDAKAQMRAGGHIPFANLFARCLSDAQALVKQLTP